MTLPASGPISINAINIELGLSGTTNSNLNQASFRSLAGIASGTIDLQDFYGKSSTTFGIINGTVLSAGNSTYQLLNTGLIDTTDGNAGGGTNWLTPATSMSSYEARATLTSGSLTSGTTATWLNLGATRAWQYSSTTPGPSSASFNLEIRDTATNTIRDTANITLFVEVI